jgi:hypothetical protein
MRCFSTYTLSRIEASSLSSLGAIKAVFIRLARRTRLFGGYSLGAALGAMFSLSESIRIEIVIGGKTNIGGDKVGIQPI